MSKEDYSHWADKRDTWFKIMQLAETEISEVKMKYFNKWNIIGNVSKEQFDKCSKEIQAIYDKYEIQVDREETKTNMTPKEKAEIIINKMFSCVDELHKYPMCIATAKQTSLIAVNEILESFIVRLTPEQMNFWNEVREEIKNYKMPLNIN